MRVKRIVFVLSIIVASHAFSAENDSFTKAIGQAKEFTVPIICGGLNPENKSEFFMISIEGTGFFVGSDMRVVTAGHVARGLFSKPRIPACPIPAIYVPITRWSASEPIIETRTVYIARCEWDLNLDVGVCDLKENVASDPNIKVKPTAAELEVSVQVEGTPVAFTGFPLSFVQPLTSKGIVATYRNVVDTIGPTDLVIDKNAWPGASGSPIYTTDGKVIGIILERGTESASGLAFGRSALFINKFLSEHPSAKK